MADPTSVAGAAASQGAGGLPQFDVAQWPGQMVWVLITFAVLYVLFAKVFVPGVGGAIDAREDKIAGDIGEARRLRDAAVAQAEAATGEMTAARARAQKLAADAQGEAKAAAAARQAGEDAKLALALAAAETRIAAARAAAMAHVRAIAIEAAQAMITRLTGTAAGAGEVERALGNAGRTARQGAQV
jgi:F-type H+-transporting ATPase subunit b